MIPEDYVHRVGRTARAKATGDAITFVSPDEEKYFSQIERALGRRLDRSNESGTRSGNRAAPFPVFAPPGAPGRRRPQRSRAGN